MSLENISSGLFIAGSSGVAGLVIGYALKKIIKILAVIVGVFLGALIYLQSQQLMEINWDKLQFVSESVLLVNSNTISNADEISIITGNLGIPLASGLFGGLVLGFSKG